VCAPNRHALIMGMYPTATGGTHMRTWNRSSAADEKAKAAMEGVPLYEATPPPEAKCFSEYLRREEYFCTNNVKTDYQFHPPKSAWNVNDRQAHWRQRPDESKPFFSIFNFTVTHESGTFEKRSPEVTDPSKITLPPYYPDTPLVRRDVARHFDNVAKLDQQVGKVLRELEEDGLSENTIVFFFSDHGDGLPRAKRWVYDSGIHVPLIVRWPNKKEAGTTSSELVSFVDMAPTVLSVAGLKVPEHMHGKAFLGEQKQPSRKYIYAVRDRMDSVPETIRAVRDSRFKYIKNYRQDLPYFGHLPYRNRAAVSREIIRLTKENALGDSCWQLTSQTKPAEEFYDCQADPHEIDNLIDDPKHKTKIAELRNAHAQWEADYVDLGLMPEKEITKKLWPPHGQQPITSSPSISATKKGDDHYLVNIACDTEGASIVYRYGDDKRWKLYTGPFESPKDSEITAEAHRIGFKPSPFTQFSASTPSP
ncbi:MAG: sulfatase, partial [Planctomycetota bacterium]